MAEAVAKETGVTLPYQVGTMIELPRAALLAGDIAESADFFSFGTNDLTQTTLGISRDDAAPSSASIQKNILPQDPFVSFDQEGVGELVKIAAERGRDAAQYQAWHLRRAWRRPGLDRLLREDRARLCLLLAFSRADCPSGGGAGGPRPDGAFDGVIYGPAPRIPRSSMAGTSPAMAVVLKGDAYAPGPAEDHPLDARARAS